MTSIANSVVTIQTSPQVVPSPPVWFGELTVIAHFLQQQGVLAAIVERVRLARRRFGRYEVIDFVAVLFGYAISGERTLEAFYEHLHPFAAGFMALFGRERLPARSTLSRFLASLTPTAVEASRALFLEDALARPLGPERACGGLVDRTGCERVVFDIDARSKFRCFCWLTGSLLPALHALSFEDATQVPLQLVAHLWQAVSGETSTRMNFIDKNASFDTRMLVHEGFDFFDRSVKDTDTFYFTAIAHRANN